METSLSMEIPHFYSSRPMRLNQTLFRIGYCHQPRRVKTCTFKDKPFGIFESSVLFSPLIAKYQYGIDVIWRCHWNGGVELICQPVCHSSTSFVLYQSSPVPTDSFNIYLRNDIGLRMRRYFMGTIVVIENIIQVQSSLNRRCEIDQPFDDIHDDTLMD